MGYRFSVRRIRKRSEDRRYDGVVAQSILRGRNTAGRLEADLAPGLGIESLDSLAHDEGGHRRGVDLHLAGRGLDEIGAGLHREEGGGGDVGRGYQQTRLKDDLQDDTSSLTLARCIDGLAHRGDFRLDRIVITGQESVERQDDVDLVRTGLDCHLTFAYLHFQETLGSGEAARDSRHMQGRILALRSDRRREVGEYADGSGQRIVRVGLGQAVHLRDEFLHGRDGVGRVKRGEIHQGEAVLQTLRRNEFIQAGGDQLEGPADLFLIRAVPVSFKQVIHIFGY